jgi:crotonobetainyl-CoA:carnitine CoA-transferase CaiB-like acyl-CoA transferase
MKKDPRYADNNKRVEQRTTMLPELRKRLAHRRAAELAELFERVGLPFAPIRKPEELYGDPHLIESGGLADIVLPDAPRAGETIKTTLFPLTMNGERLGVRSDPPTFGSATRELLRELHYDATAIEALIETRAVA